MNATLENGQSSRRVALLPIPAIEQIRAVLRDPNSPLPSGQQKLNDLFGSMERKMGKDLSGPGAHVVRLGWRVALMAGATAVWLSTLAGTLAMLAGGVGAATWLTLHQQLFRQWRGLDDNRVRQAVQERRKSLRAPFDEKKKERLKQQSARFGAYVVLLAFCPVGFLAETGARMGRNMRLRFMKRGVEQQRDELETQVNNERARIESYAERNRQSRVIELPENIPPGPAAYDSYYHASNTPPSRVQPEPAAAGVSLAADDPRRRRRRAGLSL